MYRSRSVPAVLDIVGAGEPPTLVGAFQNHFGKLISRSCVALGCNRDIYIPDLALGSAMKVPTRGFW